MVHSPFKLKKGIDMGESLGVDYYARRERQERELATRASSPEIGRIHRTLADRYAEMVEPDDREPVKVSGLRVV